MLGSFASIVEVSIKVTWNQVQEAAQAYDDNMWFQALGPREQQIICFHDIVHPLGEQEEQSMDISQSLDRCSLQFARVSCLATNSKHWLRQPKRVLLGPEKLCLQGILCSRDSRSTSATQQLTEPCCRLMAGNAINHFNFVQGIVAAIATLPPKFFLA